MIDLDAAATAAQGFGGPSEIWGHIVNDFSNITQPAEMAAFLQVLMIDIVFAGDNAIVVGALAAGLPADQRKEGDLDRRDGGAGAAHRLRGWSLPQSTAIVGLICFGGLLLVWVAWRMCRDLRAHGGEFARFLHDRGRRGLRRPPAKSFAEAAWAVAIADVAMSLDNVLAVAGAARDHPGILIVGLIFAVALMGVAATSSRSISSAIAGSPVSAWPSSCGSRAR